MWTEEELEELRKHAEEVMKSDKEAGAHLMHAYLGLKGTTNAISKAADEQGSLGKDFEFTVDSCHDLTDEQIGVLTHKECDAIVKILKYDDPVTKKVYERLNDIKMDESLDYSAGDLTVGKLRDLIKDFDDNDIVEIFDVYVESSHSPIGTYIPKRFDTHGHRRLIIEIDSD